MGKGALCPFSMQLISKLVFSLSILNAIAYKEIYLSTYKRNSYYK